jgi:hypothetical protein
MYNPPPKKKIKTKTNIFFDVGGWGRKRVVGGFLSPQSRFLKV